LLEILRLQQRVHQVAKQQQANQNEHNIFEHGKFSGLLQAFTATQIANGHKEEEHGSHSK
jgi:hypothetical protein